MRIDPIPNPPSSNSPPPVVHSSLNDPPLLSPQCSSHRKAMSVYAALLLAGNPLAGSGNNDAEGSGDDEDDGDDDDDDIGISSRETSSRVISFTRRALTFSLCVLLKPEANDSRLDRFRSLVPNSWDWAAIVADGYSGGIIALWNKNIGQVTPIAVSRRALHLVISLDNVSSVIVLIVYNSHLLHAQCSLWQELSKISTLNFPWLSIGDFNVVLSRSEHKGGSYIYYSRRSRFFLNFVDLNNLFDLNFSGPEFTWCNNQLGPSRRWARLDRGLVNSCWLDKFSVYSLKHLPRVLSDHAPLFLKISSHYNSRHKIFRFENYWLDYIGCHEAVRNAWSCATNGNPMHAFSHYISRTRFNINTWKRTGLSSLDSDINSTEASITSLELADVNDPDVFAELSDLYAKFASLQRLVSLRWAQRAHLLWLDNGDRNTAFFHNTLRIRSHFNAISQIINLDGITVFEHADIDNAFVQYYSNLWNAPNDCDFPNILTSFPGELPSISDDDGRRLIREVTGEEIYRIVLDLPSGSCPSSSSNCLAAELTALLHALQFAASGMYTIQYIFVSNLDVLHALHTTDTTCSWRHRHQINSANDLLLTAGSPQLITRASSVELFPKNMILLSVYWRSEYRLTTDLTPINLVFPSFSELAWAKVQGHSLQVDHCRIEYNPQVPFNATGLVVVEIHDERVDIGHTLQAEYCFPIACQIDLNYYSSSYFSVHDPIPLKAFYYVLDSNVKVGSHFTKFKGLLKLAAAKKSNNILYRGPSVKIHSPSFTMDDIDFKHVAKAPVSRAICRSTSTLPTFDRFLLLPGESYLDKVSTMVMEHGLSGNGPTVTEVIDVGLSISEVGCSSSSAGRASISMGPDDLGVIIGKSISEAIAVLWNGNTLPLQSKQI
ncbi:uncharacterized protein LOC120254413 [Dioscorea cayenensis subsp. rotundata]|uniref:Uncharacterized protein LOC120254413 n=1 Tax=Dioscorea cayennensis subsp. rotundata TaxID=55577 RepID=A0AB40AUH6_DIOCR|nr:uncharacterized protein LOC120254413 [Dioscorea cayenensis subsp. rotundata]